MDPAVNIAGAWSAAETKLLEQLRAVRRELRREPRTPRQTDLTTGQRVADAVAAGMGSWPFIIGQSALLAVWITLNVIGFIRHWDPYPFILLNLTLSFQAAYAAPFIMMAQNRQQDIDRKEAENDHKINIKAELEIELLHEKIDALREKEVVDLSQALGQLTELLRSMQAPGQTPSPA